MIPRKAWFYWESDRPMSWLRSLSLRSFAALNPGWTVEAIPHPAKPEGDSERARINRSDYGRYCHLEEHGGLYFDTDIVFQRAIPGHWLEGDLLAQAHPSGEVYAVAMLGCREGSLVLSHIRREADLRMASRLALGCQSLGVKLVARLPAEELLPIPSEAFLPVGWQHVERLWSPVRIHGIEPAYGVHWYGGDPLSREREAGFTAGEDSAVGEAVRRVLPLIERAGEREAHVEQHGLQ